MTSTITYTVIFALLFVFATLQYVVEQLGILSAEGTFTLGPVAMPASQAYLVGIGTIMLLSFVKAGLVAGWFQHLKQEPRSVTYLVLTGLAAAVALTVAAAYSIL